MLFIILYYPSSSFLHSIWQIQIYLFINFFKKKSFTKTTWSLTKPAHKSSKFKVPKLFSTQKELGFLVFQVLTPPFFQASAVVAVYFCSNYWVKEKLTLSTWSGSCSLSLSPCCFNSSQSTRHFLSLILSSSLFYVLSSHSLFASCSL